jgi:type II secretory pathway component GspD/PulD (secretin)
MPQAIDDRPTRPLAGPLLRVVTCALIGFVLLSRSSLAQDPPAAPRELRFNFERQPWRAVLDWLAEQADLALHVGDVPTGSFTYSDTRTYSPDQAINRINLFLIPDRYTLVRSGKLLSVISLDDERSVRQLDAMAETVQLQGLDQLGSHELVKCLFPLGDIDPEQALEELNGLLLIREPVVLRNTNQLMIIETAGKLRTVQRILDALEKPEAAVGPVKQYPLGNLDAQRVLTQVRPHVGLDPLGMIGADISLSIDSEGRMLLASGSRENLDAVASVMQMLESAAISPDHRDQLEFRPHALGESDMQTVVNVLQTLLADEDVRLAPDVRSNQLAIMATAEVHALVDKTIEDFSGRQNVLQFKAITVSSLDPRYAAQVLNDFFQPASAGTELPAEAAARAELPKINADPFTGRLFVRATASQIAEIEQILEQLAQPKAASGAKLRLLPYRGPRARQLLDSAKEFWPHADELLVLPPTGESQAAPLEREINPEPRPQPAPREQPEPPRENSTNTEPTRPLSTASVQQPGALFLTKLASTQAETSQPTDEATTSDSPSPAQIRAQWTPRGILVYSDDLQALQRFESHLQLIAGPAGAPPQRLAIFYLKHAEVDAASQLLERLLDAEQLTDPLSGLDASSGLLQRMIDITGLDSGGLGNMWTVDTVAVIPDKRLNRLFVYGTAADHAAIEQHLRVIDRENSIAQVQTYGTPRVIRLDHARAEAVAAVIRDAYAGRIAANTRERQQAAQQSRRPQQPQQQPRQQQPQGGPQNEPPRAAAPAAEQTRRSPGRDSSQQPKLTLAVDTQSNSLIVTAPQQLADEVEELARIVDREGTQAIHIMSIKNTTVPQVRDTLRRLMGEQVPSPSQPVRPRPTVPSPPTRASRPAPR